MKTVKYKPVSVNVAPRSEMVDRFAKGFRKQEKNHKEKACDFVVTKEL